MLEIYKIREILFHMYASPTMLGVVYIAIGIFAIGLILHFFPKSYFSFICEWIYEKIFEFYEGILGNDFSLGVKTYIVGLFSVVLLANFFGVLLDFVAPVLGANSEGEFLLYNYIVGPSSDIQFNLALAVSSILLLIALQFQSKGGKGFLYSYFPILGSGYLEISRGETNAYLYYILFPFVKLGDIVVSLFLGFLEIVGLIAKVISLSFRLFGNIVSGGVLIAMLVVALNTFTESITSFMGGIQFPIVFPLLLYIQSFVVALIQAMVFSLLVAIFIRVSQLEVGE